MHIGGLLIEVQSSRTSEKCIKIKGSASGLPSSLDRALNETICSNASSQWEKQLQRKFETIALLCLVFFILHHLPSLLQVRNKKFLGATERDDR